EMCHTAPYYTWHTDPTFAFGAAVPFGLNARMQSAWWHEGNGEALMNAFYAKYNLYGLLCGNTGAQMGGWFRKELNTPDDLKGIKMRIGGVGGGVVSRGGMVPLQLAGGGGFSAAGEGAHAAGPGGGPPHGLEVGPL